MRDGLADQQSGLRACPLDAQNGDEGRLSRRNVAAHRLAGLGGRALDIKEIVGDLESEAEIVGVATQGEALVVPGLAEDRPGLAGKGDEGAGLEALQPGDGADIERWVVLGAEVDHLAAENDPTLEIG